MGEPREGRPITGDGMGGDTTDEPVTSFEDALATLGMIVLVLITAANVVTRYFSDASFAWTEEFSVIVMVVMMFAGAASAARRQSHIRMDVLSQRGPPAWRRGAQAVARLATVLVFAILAATLARSGWDEFQYGELNTLDFPRWWVTAPLALLSALVAVRALGWSARATKRRPASAPGTGKPP